LDGVALIGEGASANTIGGTTPSAGNLISGNGRWGVLLASNNNVLEKNLIGTNTASAPGLGNALDGILCEGANNTLGGTAANAGNVISGNSRFGVFLPGSSATGNVIQQNAIGSTLGGTAALANTYDGVALFGGALNNTIGGTAAGAGNIISGNGRFGVYLNGSGTSNNLVQGNLIGLNHAGTAALGNTFDGVAFLEGASANTLGGTTPSAGNLISGNGRWGVLLATNNNVLESNLIGTNTASAPGLGNALDGILCEGANNTLGGTAANAGNVISGNSRFGVFLPGSSATGNVIQQNAIGTTLGGTAALANTYDGVALFGGALNNTIGGTAAGAGNVLSGNGRFGVYLNGSGTSNNLVPGNLIGLNRAGTAALGNTFDGVAFLEGASANTLGGTTAVARNVISANGRYGVQLGVTGTSNNLVQGNFIGTDATGTVALGNGTNGVNIVTGASDNTIGGTVTGAGNTIAYSGSAGVVVGDSAPDTGTVGNSILGNSIHDNGGADGLGVDLGNNGHTPNGSGPNGPNHFQDFATPLTAVVNADGSVTIRFTFSSLASSSFRIEFFLNSATEAAQGHFFLGGVSVTTDATGTLATVAGGTVTGGVGMITLTPPPGVTPTAGMQLTDTATLVSTPGTTGTPGDTSEFSFPAVFLTAP
jgi:titin